MTLKLIDAQEKDLEKIRDIYQYYVLNSTATFHTDHVSIEELKEKILIGHPKYKSFMIVCDGQVSGYCYISQYNKRQAYDRTAEVSIYLGPEFTGRGIGRSTISKLEEVARNNGIVVLLAIISGDNEHSIQSFANSGYEKSAHLKRVGEKFGKVLDVVIYQKNLE